MNTQQMFMDNYESLEKYQKEYEIASKNASEEVGKSFYELTNNPHMIGEWMQSFWEHLPDIPTIHHGAFYLICDMAEFFVFGDEDE